MLYINDCNIASLCIYLHETKTWREMYLKDVSKIAKDVSKNISDKSLKIFDLRDTKSRSI